MLQIIKNILWKLWTDERGELNPDGEVDAGAPKGDIQPWTPEGGVGGDLDGEGGLEDGNLDGVGEAAKRSAEELGEGDKGDKGESDKGEGEAEKKEGENEGESADKDKTPEPTEIELLKADLEASKVETNLLKGQMTELKEEADAKALDAEDAKDKAASDDEAKIRNALLNTPDDDLTETELKMKKYIQTLEKSIQNRMDDLDDKISSDDRARLTKEYSQRFDNIMSTHNKDGEEWLDDNDKSLIASISIKTGVDDIEKIADKLVEGRKKIFEKMIGTKVEDAEKGAVKKYLGMKLEDRKKVVEKSGDAPPPDTKNIDSLETAEGQRSLRQKMAARIRDGKAV